MWNFAVQPYFVELPNGEVARVVSVTKSATSSSYTFLVLKADGSHDVYSAAHCKRSFIPKSTTYSELYW